MSRVSPPSVTATRSGNAVRRRSPRMPRTRISYPGGWMVRSWLVHVTHCRGGGMSARRPDRMSLASASVAGRVAFSLAWAGRTEQAELPRPVDGLRPAVGAELVVDVAHVGLDRARRDVQLGRDLAADRLLGRNRSTRSSLPLRSSASLWPARPHRGCRAVKHVDQVRAGRDGPSDGGDGARGAPAAGASA